MSINEKKINNNNVNDFEKDLKTNFYSFSSQNNDISIDKNTKNINQGSLSENISKYNYVNDANKITNFSTTFQSLSRDKLDDNNDENDNTLGSRLKEIYESSSNNDLYSSKSNKKPKLSLKDSRTKLRQLREKLYPLSEEERIMGQEELLPVPYDKMDDEKYKILRMHHLKKPSLPEYKSCEKYEDYYKSFEDSLNKKNEFFLLKNKKSVYSNTKVMKLEISLKNNNGEKKFPLFKDQDIGVYEYWQVPLIENKIDEDNDSDEEQIYLAKKVCEHDLLEGINYIKKNGIESLINNRFKTKNEESNNKLKD